MAMGEPVLYAERDGDDVYRAPYLQSKTLLTAWALPADRDALQRVCDDALNTPSGGAVRYRPLLSSVLLVMADIGQIHSLDPRDRSKGFIREEDIGFWMLTGAYKMVNGEEVLDHVAFYIPYIWVTHPWAVSTGREVHGFLKSFAWAEIAGSPRDAGPFWMDAVVLPTYAPETMAVRRRVLEMTRAPEAGDGGAVNAWRDARSAGKAILTAVRGLDGIDDVDWHFLESLFDDVTEKHVPVVFLKQFRDAVHPERAAYQAILEANGTITEFRGGGFLPGDWSLDLRAYASVNVAEKLGLATTPSGKVKAGHGFWLDFSFSMDLATEVWRGT